MTGKQGYTLFDTAVGTVGIAWGDDGVTGVQLPERAGEATRARMQRHHPEASEVAPPPENVTARPPERFRRGSA